MVKDNGLEGFFSDAKRRAQELKRAKVEKARVADGKVADALRERLSSMIEYAIGRHDWYDEQRNRFLQIGLALMAAMAAVAAVFSQTATSIGLTAVLFWLFLSVGFLTGVVLLVVYNQSVAKDHPYRKIADIRSWYFAYNFPSGLRDTLSSETSRAKKEVEDIITALDCFLDRWLEFAKNPEVLFAEDLEQVFILQILQRYLAQQVKLLSRILFWGVMLTALLLGLTLCSLFYDHLARGAGTSPVGAEIIMNDPSRGGCDNGTHTSQTNPGVQNHGIGGQGDGTKAEAPIGKASPPPKSP